MRRCASPQHGHARARALSMTPSSEVDGAFGGEGKGLLWELNPGPLAPEARIIPLDQAADGETQHLPISWKSLRGVLYKQYCLVCIELLSRRQALARESATAKMPRPGIEPGTFRSLV